MAASGRYRLRFCNASRCWIILIYRLECLRTFCSLLFSIQMTPYAPFLNHAGRLRSGWRLGVYLLAFLAVMFLLGSVIRVGFAIGERAHINSSPYLEDIVFRLTLLSSALLAGWICNRWLGGLPWRALGRCFYSGWLRDLLTGSLIGGASLVIASVIAVIAGGLRFAFSGREFFLSI